MGLIKFMRIIGITLCLLVASNIANAQIFDVTKSGAKPKSDITQILLKTWKKACASKSRSKVVVPKGTYRVTQVNLKGPCKAPIEFNLQGTLQAPAVGAAFKGRDTWVAFEYVDSLTISGGGTFDGQGESAWGKKCAKNQYCGNLPINIRFNFVTNSMVRDVTSLNSKQFHVNVLGCKNFTFQHVKVIASENSLNTDGIHIGRSTNVRIIDSSIQTGDDCVSIGDGSKQISITKVSCGPGHGFSIGSLGKYPNEEPVQGVFVKSCTLKNTQNGVRIKTWPDSHPGSASDMHFEDIVMENVGNPVLIDQEYCPWNQCKAQIPSRVKISNVSFKNIRGTSSTPLAVKLVCSRGLPCQKVVVSDIDIKYRGPQGPITSQCRNVKPTLYGKQNPKTCIIKA
ncbi:Glycoside hydrolase [Trema orientale]|uniref:Glycoside hydrolase n=1 Tax=Trema orientale TaxID=63057 RepID=A0A2P5DUZ7_TREOI|nr:Glycoside hydrolase [Trema orientale]